MKWISVNSKEKPEKGQSVLVVQDPTKSATRKALFAVYDGENFLPPNHWWLKQNSDGLTESEWRVKWASIIYWMPLPEPPKNT